MVFIAESFDPATTQKLHDAIMTTAKPAAAGK
jgi:hypothetical protein